MDDCIPNLVVTENYVVQPVESIPISVVDYENVGIAHLVRTASSIPAGQVIRLTSVNSPPKQNELHPLEAEIQRDLEMKQKQYASQQRPVVMQDAMLEGILKRTNQFIQMQEKPNVVNEPMIPDDETIQLQQILLSEKNILKGNNLPKSGHVNLSQLFNTSRQMLVQGKQLVIVPENHSLINNEWETSRNDPIEMEKDVNQMNASNEVPEMTDIPLTVQNYNDSVTSEININNKGSQKSRQSSDTEDEEDDVEPVCDYEPDPESTGPTETEDAAKPNKCYMCFKSFRHKKNMYAHIRKVHSTQPKIEGGILCPLCKMHASRQEHLRQHFESLHDIRIEKEEKLFNTMEEFLSWKEFVERETLSLYISKSSPKLLANNQQKTYYKCHRSGSYIVARKEDRKKKLKVQGSNKIGATCPAAMEVTENVHGVNVTFWKTHVGHDNDLEHLVLTKTDKAKISEFLNSGAPLDKVLEKIKKEAEKAPNSPSKLTMISKQDLRNIKKLHDKSCPDLYPNYSARKKVSHGRKPMKERMLRRASQLLVIEKADLLLNLLETTEVIPEFRPKICLMIDNLISTIKRRAVKNLHKREKNHKRRRRKPNDQNWAKPGNLDQKTVEESGEEKVEGMESASGVGTREKDVPHETNLNIVPSNVAVVRKRGRPKKAVSSDVKMRKTMHLTSKC